MTKKILVKAVGSKESVDEFIAFVNKRFRVAIVGAVKPNNQDDGVHCFIDLDMEAQQ